MCVCVCVRVCVSVCVQCIHDVKYTHISLAIFAMSYFCTYLAIGHVSKFFNIGNFSTCFVIGHFCGASSSILQTTLLLSSNILEVYFYSDTRGGWRSKGTVRALITPEGFVKYVFFFRNVYDCPHCVRSGGKTFILQHFTLMFLFMTVFCCCMKQSYSHWK